MDRPEKLSNENVVKIARLLRGFLFVSEGDEYADSGWWAWQDYVAEAAESKPIYVSGLGYVEVVSSRLASYDDDNSSIFMIFKITGHDGTVGYFRKNGYHSSYDGTTWDGSFFEVYPRKKTIISYERV